MERFARAIKPRPRVNMREWISRRVVIPEGQPRPGRFRHIVPAADGLMEAFEDPDINTIVLRAPVQMTKTTWIVNSILWAASESPAEMLVYQPDDELGRMFLEERLDPIAAAVRAVMEARTGWTGTATDLLGALAESAGERVAKSKTWPASPRALSGRLRQAATFLRKIGIEIDHVKEGRARTRIIHIKAGGNSGGPDYRGLQPSAPSASSANPPKGNGTNAFAENKWRTVGELADGKGDDFGTEAGSTVRAKPLKSANTDGADAKDANLPSQTGPEKNEHQGWRATL